MCSRNCILKFLPVCPTYAFLHSGHVSLYTPDRVYLSDVWVLRVSALRMVFTVRNAIFRSVLLNVLVMKVVSFPTYVNVVHLRAAACVFDWCLLGLGVCVFGGWIGKELLCMM